MPKNVVESKQSYSSFIYKTFLLMFFTADSFNTYKTKTELLHFNLYLKCGKMSGTFCLKYFSYRCWTFTINYNNTCVKQLVE